MLDFRERQSKTWKPSGRGTKRLKNFEGTHYNTYKLVKTYYAPYKYPKANMEGWLHSKVGKPIDKVYSEFLKQWRDTYNGRMSPREYFDTFVSKSKEEALSYRCNHEFYVSNGILNQLKHKRDWRRPWRSKKDWGRKQLAYNKVHFPELTTTDNGPVFLGKFWVKALSRKIFTNVWLVSVSKFQEAKGMVRKVTIPSEQKSFLEDFVKATVAGINEYRAVIPDTLWQLIPGVIPMPPKYKDYYYTVKLSDIKQI